MKMAGGYRGWSVLPRPGWRSGRACGRVRIVQRLFEHAPIPLVRINAGRPVLLNRAFSQLFGYVQSDFPDLRSWAHSAFPDPGVRRSQCRMAGGGR